MNIPISFTDFSLKEKALVGVFAMFLVWAVFDNFFYRPVARELSSVKTTLTEMRGRVEQSQVWSEKMAPTRRLVEEELVNLKRPYLVEITKQSAEFNRIIDDALNRHDIQVKSMNPGNVQPVQGKQYQMLTYSQELNCGYHELGLYVSDLENAELLIEVIDLDITPAPDQSDRHRVQLQLNAYLFDFN